MLSGSGPFKVDRLAKVTEQIKQLAESAIALGIGAIFFQSLMTIIDRLESDPQDFGDPSYRTKKTGGTVFHALQSPLMVH